MSKLKVDKEMNIIKMVANMAQDKYLNKITPKTYQIIKIVENFISKNQLICYGGIAINNILPKKDQFYKKNEFPDYDFFSTNALKHAKELADIYYKEGYGNVEAKSGFHVGTYKIYVNFYNIADITQLDETYYNNMKKHTIKLKNIMYAPPNFLRMSLYLELSRPKGDVGRWEKIFPRLKLLNKHHPMKVKRCNNKKLLYNENNYNIIKDYLINEKIIFFGGFAVKLYSKYSKKKINNNIFDVLSIDSKSCAEKFKKNNDNLNINIQKINNIGELIPEHYSIYIDDILYANIYQSKACYTYNKIKINNKIVNIATIFTMLSFYLIFIFTNNELYDVNRILCTAYMLQEIYNKNTLKNSGLLKVYTIECFGEQETFEDILSQKKDMYEKLSKNNKDFEKWFLRYIPKGPIKKSKSKSKSKKSKKSKKTKKTKKGGSKNKNNYTLFYIFMKGCPYCIEFENNGTFNELKNEYKNIQFKEINGPNNNNFVKSHNIKTYPSIVLKKNNNYIKYPTDDRSKNKLKKFIDKNL